MALNIKRLFPLAHPEPTYPVDHPIGDSSSGSMDLQQEDIRHDMKREAEEYSKLKGKKRKGSSKSKINIIS